MITYNPTECTCIAQGCGNPRDRRGLCNAHYLRLRKSVIRGKLTWDIAEKTGLALPAIQGAPTGFLKEDSEIDLVYRGDTHKIESHLSKLRQRIMEGLPA